VSMDVIAGGTAGPFAAACVVLAVAGTTKLRKPSATRPAASALGLPDSRAAVRILGAFEVMSATAALAIGGVGAGAVAILYAALAFAAWRLHVRSPGTACGCLGPSAAPVTATHIVVNVVAALLAAIASVHGSPISAVGSGFWERAAFIVLVGCCAALVALVLDALPGLATAMRQGGSR